MSLRWTATRKSETVIGRCEGLTVQLWPHTNLDGHWRFRTEPAIFDAFDFQAVNLADAKQHVAECIQIRLQALLSEVSR